MTVGEKIQYYRKKQGLSQEELGQRLLVSRQTISLWENDQTLPTIDNLIRLKEIFHVSIDDILCTEVQQLEAPAQEQYIFTFTREEAQQIANADLRAVRKGVVVGVAAVAIAVLLAIANQFPGLLWSLVGVLSILALIHIKRLNAYRKLWKEMVDRVPSNKYCVVVHDNSFVYSVYEEEQLRRTEHIMFSEINQVRDFGEVVTCVYAGRLLLIRKTELSDDSPLHSALQNVCSKQTPKPQTGKWRKWSIALFVSAIATIWGALLCVGILSGINHMFVENMWVFYLFLPIPAASIALGFVLRSRGYKWKKNVITGVIMAVLLGIYGSFTFIFSDMYDHSDAYIHTIREYTGLELPQHSYISTQDWSGSTQSNLQGYIYYSSEIHFEEEKVRNFEASLERDDRWKKEVKTEMLGLLSRWYTYGDGDYVLLYNIDEDRWNTVPSTSGTYRFLSIFYDPDQNILYAVEYDIDYVQ